MIGYSRIGYYLLSVLPVHHLWEKWSQYAVNKVKPRCSSDRSNGGTRVYLINGMELQINPDIKMQL